jgi:CheY-like chemotaxis protein
MKRIKKVFLVDDSASENLMNKKLLESLDVGSEIVTFTSSSVALDHLKRLEARDFPSLIFLDINMPEKDGFAFLEEYIDVIEPPDSAPDAEFNTVIVVVSNHLDMENFDRAKLYKSYGVLEHIRKPMDKVDVMDLLEEHFS